MMFRYTYKSIALVLVAALLAVTACSSNPPGPSETVSEAEAAAARRLANRPSLTVTSPSNGSTVTSPFSVVVETANLELAPKGAVRDGEAHLHVITTGICVPAGEVIVDDDVHVNYGDGSADLEVDLSPGDYDLCIQAGDGFHVAVGITTMLSVTVVP